MTVTKSRAAAPARPAGQQPRLLLVVDQFEQLFTQCPEEQQRQAFIIALHAAATAGHGTYQAPAALVVLGVRADFEARCAEYPQLAGAIQDRYLLTSMNELQLRMAITEPAKKAGSSVENDLVENLLRDVSTHQPTPSPAAPQLGTVSSAGVLPLLSHALDQSWRNRVGDVLTLADYDRIGGIAGAVADSAQHAYKRLTPAQQATARQVFTRLTATSSEGADVAKRVDRTELTGGWNKAEADVEAVLEAFVAERLLTVAAGTVEISHEALLTAWPLLRDTWLAETHADRIVRTRLDNTASEWARNSRNCGTSPTRPSPAQSGNPSAPATAPSTRWRSARTGIPWPAAATTAPSGCGTSPTRPSPAQSGSPSPATPTPSTRWRSARTGTRWPPAALTVQAGYGTSTSITPFSGSAPLPTTLSPGRNGSNTSPISPMIRHADL